MMEELRLTLQMIRKLLQRIFEPVTHGANVTQMFGCKNLALIFFVVVLAMVVLLCLLDCVCPDEAATD